MSAATRESPSTERNRHRFPDDFMFQLTAAETLALRSQIATSKQTAVGRGGRRTRAYAFTEHGALMAATVLNSPRAVEMSIYLVRAFVRLRELIASNAVLERRLDASRHRFHGGDHRGRLVQPGCYRTMAPPARRGSEAASTRPLSKSQVTTCRLPMVAGQGWIECPRPTRPDRSSALNAAGSANTASGRN